MSKIIDRMTSQLNTPAGFLSARLWATTSGLLGWLAIVVLCLGGLPAGESSHALAADTPPALEVAGHFGGNAGEVAADGDRVFMASGPEVTMLDVSDPANPRRVGYALLPGYVEGLAVNGSYVYASWYAGVGSASCDEGGIRIGGLVILDVSDLAHPKEVNTFPLPGGGSGLTLSGKYLYALWRSGDFDITWGGIKVLDVSNPSAPSVAGSMDLSTAPRRMVIHTNYGYIIDINGCNSPLSALTVFDLQDPLHPTEVWADYFHGGEDVTISGNFLYIANAYLMEIWDLSDPATPVQAGTFIGQVFYQGVAVQGRYAYLAQRPTWEIDYGWIGGGLWVVDVISPTQPVMTGYYQISSGARDVAAQGSTVYVSGPFDGLFVFDAADPANPRLSGAYRVPGWADGLAVAGTEAYVVSGMYVYPGGASSLRAVNVTHPAQAYQQGWMDLYRSLDLTVDGKVVYAASSVYINNTSGWKNRLHVIDASDPNQLVELGVFPLSNDEALRQLSAQNGYVYQAHRSKLDIVDARQPATMTLAAEIPYGVEDAVVAGRYLYLPANGLLIYDVSDPAQPSLAGWCVCGGGSYITLWDHYAYLMGGPVLHVVDVSDPSHPTETGSLTLTFTSSGVEDMAAEGGYVFLASGSDGLLVIDARDPAHPVQVASYDPPFFMTAVAVQRGMVYTANWPGGVYVSRFNPLFNELFLPAVMR